MGFVVKTLVQALLPIFTTKGSKSALRALRGCSQNEGAPFVNFAAPFVGFVVKIGSNALTGGFYRKGRNVGAKGAEGM